ncbi:MAG: dTDP-4-dehydrorhamnose 3,5-epimerase [Candidatus Woesebacteria bacterium]
MKITPTKIPDVKIIEPDTFPDERGLFFESYNQEKFVAAGITENFNQDNISISKKRVLRGLHFQKPPYAQAKLVSVVVGEVFDVAVDLRTDSSTYKQWVGVTLSGDNHLMLFVPKGFAHGFYVLSEEARFVYKCAGFYNKESSSGIMWNDPTIGVQWPIPAGESPILSTQDASLPRV